MGIKDFFRKVGNGIRKAGRFVRDKVFPVIGRIAKPVLNVIGALPGKIGMIGKIGSGIANVLHGGISQIPNEEARKRLDNIIARGNEGFQSVVDRGRDAADRANRYVGAGRDIVQGVSHVIKHDGKDILNHFKKLPVDLASKIGPN